MMTLETLPTNEILKTLLRKGGDFSEIFLEKSRKTTIISDDKKLEKVTTGVDCGVGLRLLMGENTSYGYTNELTSPPLLQLALAVGAAGAGKIFTKDINLQKKNPTVVSPVKIAPDTVSLEQKIKEVQKAETLAWSLDKKIVQVRIQYSDLNRHIEIANSLGEWVDSPTTLCVMSVQVTASDGKDFQRGYHSMGGHHGFEAFDPQKVEELVRIAAKRALINLTAQRARGGTMTVIIGAQAGGTMVHEAVGHGLEADLAGEGLSIYEGKIGQKVGSEKITVWDDPSRLGLRGSYSFDDEGVPAQKAVLIEKGILKNYLHSRLTAQKMGTVSNAHGRRESYACRPIVRMANTILAPGTDDPASIIRSVDSGLYVTMMGGGEVNTVNGDFVFEVSEGYKIERGQIGEPVRGATLTGNGPDVLSQIDLVGNDLGFSIGTCGKDGQGAPVADAMPTVRIPKMVVGGLI